MDLEKMIILEKVTVIKIGSQHFEVIRKKDDVLPDLVRIIQKLRIVRSIDYIRDPYPTHPSISYKVQGNNTSPPDFEVFTALREIDFIPREKKEELPA